MMFFFLVPAFVISYLHADQKWSSASLAVVFIKADLALDGVRSLSPAASRTFGVDMFASHESHW